MSDEQRNLASAAAQAGPGVPKGCAFRLGMARRAQQRGDGETARYHAEKGLEALWDTQCPCHLADGDPHDIRPGRVLCRKFMEPQCPVWLRAEFERLCA